MSHQLIHIFPACGNFFFTPQAALSALYQEGRDTALGCPAVKSVLGGGCNTVRNREIFSGSRSSGRQGFRNGCWEEDQRSQCFIDITAMQVHQEIRFGVQGFFQCSGKLAGKGSIRFAGKHTV